MVRKNLLDATRKHAKQRYKPEPEFKIGDYFEFNVPYITEWLKDPEWVKFVTEHKDYAVEIIGYKYNEYKGMYIIYYLDEYGRLDGCYEKWITILKEEEL